jgi:hypothetical protein
VFRRDPRECASKKRTIVIVRFRECFTDETFEVVQHVARIRRDRSRRAHPCEGLARKDVDPFVCSAHATRRTAVECGERVLDERAR